MDKVINEKFRITRSEGIDENGTLEIIYFLTKNMFELDAFVMADIEGWGKELKETEEILSNAKTEQEIAYYLIEIADWEIVEDFKEEDFKNDIIEESETYLLDFVEFKIAVRNKGGEYYED